MKPCAWQILVGLKLHILQMNQSFVMYMNLNFTSLKMLRTKVNKKGVHFIVIPNFLPLVYALPSLITIILAKPVTHEFSDIYTIKEHNMHLKHLCISRPLWLGVVNI